MSLNINQFKSKMPGGGARPNLFKVQIYMPHGGDLAFLAKSASLPASTVGVVEVPYMGRKIKLAGDREFPEWTISVLNDTDFKLRNAFEEWSALINQHSQNTGNQHYFYDGEVMQLDRQNKVVKMYHFHDLWPANIAAIELSHETNNTIESFDVTLQYNYWTSGHVQ